MLVFGGTPSLDDRYATNRATNAADAVINQLKAEGSQGFVFTKAQYHSPFLFKSQFGMVQDSGLLFQHLQTVRAVACDTKYV